jgi:hypothetical protein
VVEIQFDTNEGTYRAARRSYSSKTMADIDEMYAFIASPTLGQVRFGDEDGPFGGLMNAGFVTNFGTGGVYGDWQDFVIRPNRTTTSPGDMGDNTKVIYCRRSSSASTSARPSPSTRVAAATRAASAPSPARTATAPTLAGRDRPSAAPPRTCRSPERVAGDGPLARQRGPGRPRVQRRHHAVRRGCATSPCRAASATLRSPEVYQVGAQATAYGFTVGGTYMWGNTDFFYIPRRAATKRMEQWFAGALLHRGPFTIGGNVFAGQ